MTALVGIEAVAILLLSVLVAGLLRSHADILRALHQMGGRPLRRASWPRHSRLREPRPAVTGRSGGGGRVGRLRRVVA